jgi:hypothetical protein
MAQVSVTGKGATLDGAVRHAVKLLNEVFGEGNWVTDPGWETAVDILPFLGGGVGEVEVTVHAKTESHPAFARLPGEAG